MLPLHGVFTITSNIKIHYFSLLDFSGNTTAPVSILGFRYGPSDCLTQHCCVHVQLCTCCSLSVPLCSLAAPCCTGPHPGLGNGTLVFLVKFLTTDNPLPKLTMQTSLLVSGKTWTQVLSLHPSQDFLKSPNSRTWSGNNKTWKKLKQKLFTAQNLYSRAHQSEILRTLCNQS